VARLLALVLLVITAIPVSASARVIGPGDVVTLRNGDRLTGEILRFQRGRLEFDPDEAGNVKFDWEDIATLQAAGPFDVELFSGRHLRGALTPASAGSMIVVADGASDTVSFSEVVRLARDNEKLLSGLEANVNVGFSAYRASKTKQLTIGGAASLDQPNVETDANLDVFVSTVEDDPEATRGALALSHSRLSAERWIAGAYSRLERNVELGLAFRGSLAPAFGRRLVESDRQEFDLLGGLNGTIEVPFGASSGLAAEGLLIARTSYFTRHDPETSISGDLRLMPSFSDWGRLRSEFDTDISRELFGDFTIGISLYLTYDSRPPDQAQTKYDYGLVTSFGWKF
jgi:hypothetical protein